MARLDGPALDAGSGNRSIAVGPSHAKRNLSIGDMAFTRAPLAAAARQLWMGKPIGARRGKILRLQDWRARYNPAGMKVNRDEALDRQQD
jgi:hypothetical protein